MAEKKGGRTPRPRSRIPPAFSEIKTGGGLNLKGKEEFCSGDDRSAGITGKDHHLEGISCCRENWAGE